jgi:hypothetical protein
MVLLHFTYYPHSLDDVKILTAIQVTKFQSACNVVEVLGPEVVYVTNNFCTSLTKE